MQPVLCVRPGRVALLRKIFEAPEKMRLSFENLDQITDIKMLERLLDMTKEYEQRKKIRAAIRALKRGEKATISAKDLDTKKKPSISQLKADLESKKNANESKSSYTPRDVAKESKLSTREPTKTEKKSDIASKYSLDKTERTTSRMTSSAGKKKVGSIFDREVDDDDRKKKPSSSRLGDLEKRQAERRRELQRNRSMPATSAKNARKAFVAKLEADAPKTPAKKVGRSPTFTVPNANNAKQLLLKWCQSKTRGYEHVDIMNFSSSWASGMAFCALVHNFFPQAFDYSKLDPKNKAENMDLAFKKADELGDVPQLLDTEDMVTMHEPDWKCVLLYIGEFYKRIRDLGLN